MPLRLAKIKKVDTVKDFMKWALINSWQKYKSQILLEGNLISFIKM